MGCYSRQGATPERLSVRLLSASNALQGRCGEVGERGYEKGRRSSYRKMGQMKKLLLASVFTTASISANAQSYKEPPATGTPLLIADQIFRDSSGRTIGTASKSGNMTIFRDANGRTTGTATTDSQGTTIFRDSQGRTTGTT